MSQNERFVTVDDRDPSIQWDGPWSNVTTTPESFDWTNQGPAFLSTLQGIDTNGSFSFSFSGTSVYVYGSLSPRDVSTEAGDVRDPDWECFLDGDNGGMKHWEYPSLPYSNYELCSHWDLVDEDHVLELRAIVHGEKRFWVDYIQYQASAQVDISTAWTQVDWRDGRFKYSNNWGEPLNEDYGAETRTFGASFTYEFDGEAIILGGYTPGNNSVLTGLGTYSLDFGPPIEFQIHRTTSIKVNRPLFRISPDSMKPGPHHLEVVNKGNESTAALAFRYIYTKNAPVQSTTPSPSQSTGSDASTAPIQSATGTLQTPTPRNTAKIVGGAIGGGIGMVLLAVLLVVTLVRNRRRERAERMHTISPLILQAPGASGAIPIARPGPQDIVTTPGQRLPDFRRHDSQPPQQSYSRHPSSPQLPYSQSRPPSYTAPSSPPPTFYTGDFPSTPSPVDTVPPDGVGAQRIRCSLRKVAMDSTLLLSSALDMLPIMCPTHDLFQVPSKISIGSQ